MGSDAAARHLVTRHACSAATRSRWFAWPGSRKQCGRRDRARQSLATSRARAQADEVWERVAPAERGKGYALGWALARLERSGRPFDAVVVLDADCVVSANMLSAIDQTLRSGTSAVQVSYCVGNPAASR